MEYQAINASHHSDPNHDHGRVSTWRLQCSSSSVQVSSIECSFWKREITIKRVLQKYLVFLYFLESVLTMSYSNLVVILDRVPASNYAAQTQRNTQLSKRLLYLYNTVFKVHWNFRIETWEYTVILSPASVNCAIHQDDVGVLCTSAQITFMRMGTFTAYSCYCIFKCMDILGYVQRIRKLQDF